MRLILLIFIIPFFLFANDIDTLMEKSGLNTQIATLKDSSLAYLDLLDETSDMQILFKNRLYKNFDEEVLISKVKESLQKSLSDQEIKELLSWYDSDIGSSIVKAEIESSKPDNLTKMTLALATLTKDKKRVDSTIKIEYYLKYSSYSMRLTQTLFETLLPDSNLPSRYKKIFYEVYAEKMYYEVIAFFLFAYRDVSYEYLDMYIEFLGKQSAKKFSQTVMDTQLKVLIEWIFKSMQESKNIV